MDPRVQGIITLGLENCARCPLWTGETLNLKYSTSKNKVKEWYWLKNTFNPLTFSYFDKIKKTEYKDMT